MYLWKYWRDTRLRLIVLLALGLALRIPQLVFDRRLPGTVTVAWYWQNLAGMALISLLLPGLIAPGFTMAGPGEEFAQGTAEFLFTRPRSRRYFIWCSWAAGALELLAGVCFYVLAAFLATVYVTKTLYTWKFLVMILPGFLSCFVVYGVISLMSALLRGGQKGYAWGLLLIGCYLAVRGSLLLQWNLHLPLPTDLANSFESLMTGAQASTTAFHFPVAGVIGWTLFAMACPLLAQLYIERSEI